MLTCTEKGFWPDELGGTLDEIELDRLVEHAMVCDFHRALLDRDEETFLSAFRAAEFLTPACARSSHHVWNDGVDTGFTAGASLPDAAWQPAMVDLALKHYERFRRWERDRCPLEVLQARWGEHSVAVLELYEGGSAWRLYVERNTTAIQFWTFCRLHSEQLLLATYPLNKTLCAGEVSEIQFANGQTLGVSVTRGNDGGGFDVYLSCTPPSVLRESGEIHFRTASEATYIPEGYLSPSGNVSNTRQVQGRFFAPRVGDLGIASLLSPVMSQEEKLDQKEHALLRDGLETKIHQIAWQVFDSSAPEEKTIFSLWTKGKTLQQISEETGMALATTHRRLKKLQRAIVEEVGKGIIEEIGEVRAEEHGIAKALKEVVEDRNYVLALLGNRSLDMARYGRAPSVG